MGAVGNSAVGLRFPVDNDGSIFRAQLATLAGKGAPDAGFRRAAYEEGLERQRARVQTQLRDLLGRLPARPAVPAVRTLIREDRGHYVVEKFEFDNAAGATVPGYLVLPKNAAGPLPAILYCHWHGGEYGIGKEELFQAKHTPEPPGPTLARRDMRFWRLTPTVSGNGADKGRRDGRERRSGGNDGEQVQLVDGPIALGHDLARRPDGIGLSGITAGSGSETSGRDGISMGATRSWWLMALDDRLQTGVAVACLTRYQDLIAHQALPAHGIYYFVPGMLNHFDTEAVIALLAPRPVLLMTGDQDDGSPRTGCVTSDRWRRRFTGSMAGRISSRISCIRASAMSTCRKCGGR